MKPAPILIALLGLAATVPAAAAGSGVGFGISGGTLGVGAEVSYPLTDRLGMRGLIAGIDVGTDFEADDDGLEYDGDLELRNAAALLDFHPWSGSFRLTGGVVFSNNEVRGTARCEQVACDFGDGALATGDEARATVDFAGASPYLGLGWGSRPAGDSGWGITADIGVFYLGDPDAEVTIEGPSSANPVARQQAQQEEDEIEDDLDSVPLYPVLMVGASYRF